MPFNRVFSAKASTNLHFNKVEQVPVFHRCNQYHIETILSNETMSSPEGDIVYFQRTLRNWIGLFKLFLYFS